MKRLKNKLYQLFENCNYQVKNENKKKYYTATVKTLEAV